MLKILNATMKNLTEPFFVVVLVSLFLVCEWLKKPAVLLGESLWLAIDLTMFPFFLPAGGRGVQLSRLSAALCAWGCSWDFPHVALAEGRCGLGTLCWRLDCSVVVFFAVLKFSGGAIVRKLG
jgi:hypothetical protein